MRALCLLFWSAVNSLRRRRMRVAVLRQGAQGTNAHENQSDHGSTEIVSANCLTLCKSGNLHCTHWTLSPFVDRCSYFGCRAIADAPSDDHILLESALWERLHPVVFSRNARNDVLSLA